MGRKLYIAVHVNKAAKEGYLDGTIRYATGNMVQIMIEAAQNAMLLVDGDWCYLTVCDGNSVTKIDFTKEGMIAREVPVVKPFGDNLRGDLSDWRAAMLGGMRASDSRERVELPIDQAHGKSDEEMVDLNLARNGVTDDPSESRDALLQQGLIENDSLPVNVDHSSENRKGRKRA